MRIGIIGGGQMGSALIGGLISAKAASPGDVTVCDVDAQARERLEREIGVATTDDLVAAAVDHDVVLIAVKPQVIRAVLPKLSGRIAPTQTVISIAAGVTSVRLESLLGGDDGFVHVVRAMPNTPALVGEGMSAISAGTRATPEDLARAETIMSSVGKVVRVEERLMDAVVGLSGSGPGYVYTVIEALADGGCRAGLPKPLALELAAQTVLGAARMVIETGGHPAVLRDRVTSPGGTTIAGLHAAESAGLRDALMSAVLASARRAEELGR